MLPRLRISIKFIYPDSLIKSTRTSAKCAFHTRGKLSTFTPDHFCLKFLI